MIKNYNQQIVRLLGRLKKAYPFYNIGRHISIALDDNKLWEVTDKELYLALKKYEIELNMDVTHNDIEDIIEDGLHLERTLFEEEED
jgi:hypothetical protein